VRPSRPERSTRVRPKNVAALGCTRGSKVRAINAREANRASEEEHDDEGYFEEVNGQEGREEDDVKESGSLVL
jgi:hypothetical protein